jgi:hypothetical protein
MFAAQTFTGWQTCKTSAAGSFYFSCPYQSSIRVGISYYNLKVIVRQSSITNMVMVSRKFNTDKYKVMFVV